VRVHGTKKKRLEEVLEGIWTLREAGGCTLEELHAQTGEPITEELLEELQAEGMVRLRGEEVELTEKGERLAREVVRRHRLAERLLSDVLELSESVAESHACEFEHLLSPEATDSVCTFLGHPPTCPHGKPIPRGECCSKLRKEVHPLVTPLSELEVGAEAKIVFISPRRHSTLDRLASLGVVPGSTLKLHQRSPAYVIRVGELEVALDPEIAGEIYVKAAVKQKHH